MALDKFKASPLPNPPSQWDPQYMRQVIRVLETYFSQLDSRAANNASQYTADFFYGSGIYLTIPFGQFSSSTDQTAAAIDQAYALTYDATDFSGGITLSSGSRLTVPNDGIYNVAFSIQFKNDSNSIEDIDIWLRKNGTDITSSNSRFSIPARKGAGNPSHLIAVTPVMVELAAGDYIQIMWHVTNTTVSVEQYPAVTAVPGTTPAYPATPSAFVQVEFVSLPV
jgi:hypothetical protein